MSKKERRKIQVKSVKDVTSLGQITKEELLADMEKFDKVNYNPLESDEDKEVLIPDHKTEIITVRLTRNEKEKLKKIARENGLTGSALVRMIITRSLKKQEFFL
jgi:LysM repeat protein